MRISDWSSDVCSSDLTALIASTKRIVVAGAALTTGAGRSRSAPSPFPQAASPSKASEIRVLNMRTKSRYALAGGSSSAVSRNQELDISFGSRDRAWGDSLDTPSAPFQPVRNRPADAQIGR